jgi:hypothetical protein
VLTQPLDAGQSNDLNHETGQSILVQQRRGFGRKNEQLSCSTGEYDMRNSV